MEKGLGNCYAWTTSDGISATALTDPEYPEKAAFTLLNKLVMEFRDAHERDLNSPPTKENSIKFAQLEAFMKEWQNPHEADKLLKIEKDIIDVAAIVHKNLEDLLKRGETLDELMAKSNDLSKVSVDFYKKAKKTNSSCCQLN